RVPRERLRVRDLGRPLRRRGDHVPRRRGCYPLRHDRHARRADLDRLSDRAAAAALRRGDHRQAAPGVTRYQYLLGDRRREAGRLRAQARLWDPVSLALFDRIGVAPGWRVLEIGPGQGSLHMELRRRVKGPIDAVERSAPFAARLRKLCARDGRGAGTIWERDLIDAPLPKNKYDLIFARWVFLFLPEPQMHLRKL